LSTLKNGRTAGCGQAVPRSSTNHQGCETGNVDHDWKSAFGMRSQRATPRDLLKAWDLDLWHMSHSPINPNLKPLTAEELEALVTRFPDVMPHVYVRPDAVLFRTATSEGNLMEVLRHDLVSPGELQIYVRGCVDVWEWCGGVEGTADVLAFNTMRIKAIHQTLAPLIRLGH
jgi:hypothetical protein